MMHDYCKYADETEVVFTDIMKNEDGEEIIHVHFERPTEHGFDGIRFELPSYEIVEKDGHFSDKEIQEFRETVEKGAQLFFKLHSKIYYDMEGFCGNIYKRSYK